MFTVVDSEVSREDEWTAEPIGASTRKRDMILVDLFERRRIR
jgi:hypothetical protein